MHVTVLFLVALTRNHKSHKRRENLTYVRRGSQVIIKD